MKFCSKPSAAFIALALGVSLMASCGYHVVGQQNLVPKTVSTIAIPPFQNATVRYRLTDLLPEAVSREFISRTKYQIVNDPTQADAVLRGTVLNYVAYPTLIDQTNGRTSAVQINVGLNISFVERATGKVIYSQPNYLVHERYELSATNDTQYFDESSPAVQRLSKDVARDLVTSILTNF